MHLIRVFVIGYLEHCVPSLHLFDRISYLALRLAPRLIVLGFAGYYSLGVAYEKGIMAAIDRVAIRILRHYVGYAGLGAIMPTFQWYAAWSVRALAAIGAGILYDLIERIILSIVAALRGQPRDADENKAPPLHPAPIDRKEAHHLPKGFALLNEAPKDRSPLRNAPKNRSKLLA